MALLRVPEGLKSSDEVIRLAFARFGCEPMGGPTEQGWSRQGDFLRCPYRYFLKHIRKVVPALQTASSSKPQDVGSLMHTVLAVHYARLLPPPVQYSDGAVQAYPGWQEGLPTPEEMLDALRDSGAEIEALQEARRLWDSYLDYWGEDGWQPVAVEMFAGNPELHTSRDDLVFIVADGIHDGLWIGEHKTASPSTDFEQWQMHGEVLGEMLTGLEALPKIFGMELQGVCINILIKSKVPGYRRIWLPVDEKLIREFVRQRLHWQKMEQLYTKSGFWPKSFHGCQERFGRCGYWDHCVSLSEQYLTPKVFDE